jgi:hypothetical protein
LNNTTVGTPIQDAPLRWINPDNTSSGARPK